MALTTVLPSVHLATATSAAACISSLEASRATSMRPRLAEHLHDNLHRVLDGLGQVELGPGGGIGVALAAECLMPQLIGQNGQMGQGAHDVLSHAVAQGLVARGTLGGVEVGARRVDEFHDGRDGGVELAAIEVSVHLAMVR
mgnify:CR=1 FL=1